MGNETSAEDGDETESEVCSSSSSSALPRPPKPSRASPAMHDTDDDPPPVPHRSAPPLPSRKVGRRNDAEKLAQQLQRAVAKFDYESSRNNPQVTRRFVRVVYRVAQHSHSAHELFLQPGEIIELIDTADELDELNQLKYPGWWRGRVAVSQPDYAGAAPQRSEWFHGPSPDETAFDRSALNVERFQDFATAVDDLLWRFTPHFRKRVHDAVFDLILRALFRKSGRRPAIFLEKLYRFLRGIYTPGVAEALKSSVLGQTLRIPQVTALFPSNCVELLDELPSTVEALYDWPSPAEGCMSLQAGDRISITSGPEIEAVRPRGARTADDDWWAGINTRTQEEGIFPSNYVAAVAATHDGETARRMSPLLQQLHCADQLAKRASYLGLDRGGELGEVGGASPRPGSGSEVNAISTISPSLKTKINSAFASADFDGSGELDVDEFTELVVSLGLPHAAAVAAFKHFDSSGDGFIDRDEASDALRQLWYHLGDGETHSNLPGASLTEFVATANIEGVHLFNAALNVSTSVASPSHHRKSKGREHHFGGALSPSALRRATESELITPEESALIAKKLAAHAAHADSPFGRPPVGTERKSLRAAIVAADRARIKGKITAEEEAMLEVTLKRAYKEGFAM